MFKTLIATFLVVGMAAPAFAQTYRVDPRHTHVNWAVSRMGGITFRGKLARNTGAVMLDAAAGKGEVEISLDARGAMSGNDMLDKVLLTASFFNVEKFATASYKSSNVAFNGQAPVRVEGELTMLGVTRPVTLTITNFKCGVEPFSKLRFCAADATATIKRSDWGMIGAMQLAGDEVKIDVAIEAYDEADIKQRQSATQGQR